MIISDPRRGATEMDLVRSLVTRFAHGVRGGLKVDGNAIVRDLVDELERSGPRLPESTRNVLRLAAARVLMLLSEAPK